MSKKMHPSLMLKKMTTSWQKAFGRLFPLGGFSSGNEVSIIHSGDEAFLAIFEAVKQAKKSIYLETYILMPDRVGVWIRDALIEANKRGVKVILLYDHLGSVGLSAGFLKPMADHITVLSFNSIWGWPFKRHPLLFRDHRKIIVIDEEIAFCGGMNIGADYAGPIYGNDRYRDTFAQVRGPAVKDLLAITKESIAMAKGGDGASALKEKLGLVEDKALTFKHFLARLFHHEDIEPFPEDQGTLVQVLRSNMRSNLAHIQKAMEESVNRAVHYCYFTTPYFLPPPYLRKALINAKLRGVDVRILTAGLSDVPLMRYASRHVYGKFLAQGIRIYEMTGKTLHAKIATIDGVYSWVGSYNLDHWSARRNLEVNLTIIDQKIAHELKEQFKQDLTLSHEIKPDQFLARSMLRRFLCWVAYIILRL